MGVLEAFDLTGPGWRLFPSHGRWVCPTREAGGQLDRAAARPLLIDEVLPRVASQRRCN